MMADDTIKSLNLLSSLKSLAAGVRQEFAGIRQETGGINNLLGSASSRMQNWASGRWDQRFGATSNQVAPYPTFSVDPQGQTTRQWRDGNRVFSNEVDLYKPLPQIYTGGPVAPQPSDGSRGLTPFQQRTMAAGMIGSMGMIPGVKEAVEYELGTSRMVFYQQQAGYTGGRRDLFGLKGVNPFGAGGTSNPSDDYKTATALLQELGRTGTVTGKFDTLKAMEVARQYGINSPNFSQVALGTAQMSNITPGIGVEGSMRAYGAMQQARNVNMLRGIGIRIRGEDGSMKPMPQIIDEIWNKLNREKMGNEPITVQDVTISLQPGNALASMLDQYFGNDPLLRKQVEDGLILKARSGGAQFSGRDLKKLGEKYGATTPAVSSLSQRIDEKTKTLQQLAPTMSDAFTFANRIFSNLNGMLNLIDRFTGFLKGLGFLKAGSETAFPSTSGFLSGLIGNLTKLLPFKAEGGPVGGQMPYIVGEQGPELFVPKVDGKIIPNHEIKDVIKDNSIAKFPKENYPFRHMGDEVHNKSHNAPDTRPKGAGAKALSEEELTKILKEAGFEGQGLANALKISRAESGGRPYAWNPHDKDLSYGLFQINMLGDLMGERMNKSWKAKDGSTFKLGKVDDLYDPLINAKVAYHMSQKGYNWSQWSTKGVLGGGSAGASGAGAAENKGGSDGGGSGDSKFAPGEKFNMAKFLSGTENSNRNLMSQFLKGFTSMSKPTSLTTAQSQPNSTTYNYGGVTVNVTGARDPQSIIGALKSALTNTDVLNTTARS